MGETIIPETPENDALLWRVVQRVIGRLERGEGPPLKTPPQDKGSYPKLLCLDMNKWIDLGRAHYGTDEGRPFVDALAAVKEAIARGTLLVPVMPSNVLEVFEPRDEARRRRTAEFMVDLSGNQSFINPRPVLDAQLRRAVMRQYLGVNPGPFPRDRLLHWGMSAALHAGMPRHPFLAQALEEPEVSVLALVHAIDRETVERGRRMDENAAT